MHLNQSLRLGRAYRLRRSLLAVGASALATGSLAATAVASPGVTPPDASGSYSFTTLNDQADPTFNQLLGINNSGLISGYFGSGATLHPNKGYTISPPYGQGNYQNENFPGSEQTQVTGLNNKGVTVGFWVDGVGNNHGFYSVGSRFRTADFPSANQASPKVDQLLGVNDHGRAVGFYTDKHGMNHGYSYKVATHRFSSISVTGDSNVTAAGINNRGDIAGFATNGAGTTEAYLLRSNGKVVHLNYPGSASTQAFGVNKSDEVVGSYTVTVNANTQTHGFVWKPGFGFTSVDDPNGVGATTLNGVNDRGDLVGFYTDAATNTDGLLATPVVGP